MQLRGVTVAHLTPDYNWYVSSPNLPSFVVVCITPLVCILHPLSLSLLYLYCFCRRYFRADETIGEKDVVYFPPFFALKLYFKPLGQSEWHSNVLNWSTYYWLVAIGRIMYCNDANANPKSLARTISPLSTIMRQINKNHVFS